MTPRRPLVRLASAALIGLALAGAGAAAIADPPKGGYAPDPTATATRKQWVFDFAYAKGKASIPRVRPVTLDRPAATARVTGRFAIELYIGKELLDRVRFNVPLTGDAPEKDPRHFRRRPTFDEGVTTRIKVQMADSPRTTWVKLVDRLTGDEQRFWWPPGDKGQLTPITSAPVSAGSAPDPGAVADAAPAPEAVPAPDAATGPDAAPAPAPDAASDAASDAAARSDAR